ncbi:hypothetical protein [Clostridium lundense]|uniref:hypothetical protein n=1 Tax=Clostridium lundense TaxID=319475 RepID=UPI000558ECB6|nr:hypothetical protein [Clostridium lundense]
MKFNLDKEFARKLAVMIDSRLIWYKHYYLWCDEIIEISDNPPSWILDISIEKNRGSALNILYEYIHSEPFEHYIGNKFDDLYIGCLYLKYCRREISWATFLNDAGVYSDGTEMVKFSCEYFYHLLNRYEDSGFSMALENVQHLEVKKEFYREIEEINQYYNVFLPYYEKYLKSKGVI